MFFLTQQNYRIIPMLRKFINHYAVGCAVIFFILFFYAQSLISLFSVNPSSGSEWLTQLQDPYLRRVIAFSFYQALLSTVLSILIGILFARAFFYTAFRGKSLILRFFSLTFVLPNLVAVFGLLGIYGATGWLSQLFQFMGWQWNFRLYGLTGILIAHCFFNIPLAARIALQALQSIPNEQHRLSALLNLRGWQFFRLVEFSYLKSQLIPAFVLIFMLCFTSFAIVLVLGGGPQYSTLEVGIYQALFFEFDLPRAALFALIQFIFCFFLFGVSQFFAKPTETYLQQKNLWLAKRSNGEAIWHFLVLLIVSLFLFSPLLNIIAQGLFSPQFFSIWTQKAFWKALLFTLTIAPSAGLLALVFSVAILLLSRRLQWFNYQKIANLVLTSGMIILAIPSLILAMGLFILLQDFDVSTPMLFLVVVICNALASMPFVLRILNVPMYQNLIYYERLCQSLNITGWQRFRLIEWQSLKTPIKYAFALACAFSLGDFTAIALFGNQDFSSLPQYLYGQLGKYKTQEGAVTALVLLLLCLGLFFFIERNKEKQ